METRENIGLVWFGTSGTSSPASSSCWLLRNAPRGVVKRSGTGASPLSGKARAGLDTNFSPR